MYNLYYNLVGGSIVMLQRFVFFIIIAFFSFFGLDLLAQLVDIAMGNNSIDDDFHAIIVVGTIVICCTYLIISKINELKDSLHSHDNDDNHKTNI